MPSSRPALIPRVIRVVQTLRPSRVLDVGFGFGKYGLLCREYLDLWAQPPRYKPPWGSVIDGIEGHADYVGDHQRAIYDHIFLGEALDLVAAMPDAAYDLALVIDVIEHFSLDRGRRFLEEALRVSRFVMVTTPRRFQEQGEVHGNPLEVHTSAWRPADFRAIAPAAFLPDRRTLIAVLSRTSPEELAQVTSGGVVRRYLAKKLRKLTGRR